MRGGQEKERRIVASSSTSQVIICFQLTLQLVDPKMKEKSGQVLDICARFTDLTASF